MRLAVQRSKVLLLLLLGNWNGVTNTTTKNLDSSSMEGHWSEVYAVCGHALNTLRAF